VRIGNASFGTATRLGVVVLAVAGMVAGCGGASANSSAAGSSPSASASSRASRAGFDPALRQQIQDCLTAAGIAVPTGSGRPSGAPSGEPSNRPTGRPSGASTGRPSGVGGGAFADPKAQAALKACGITIPSFRTGATPSSSS